MWYDKVILAHFIVNQHFAWLSPACTVQHVQLPFELQDGIGSWTKQCSTHINFVLAPSSRISSREMVSVERPIWR